MTQVTFATGQFPKKLSGVLEFVDTPPAGYQTVNVGGDKVGGTATNLVNDVPATFGYQEVAVGGNKTTGSATGLTNDATVYTASISIDGGAHIRPISIVGSAAQTYADLITELESDSGAFFNVTIEGGNLRITADGAGGAGASSAVAITDTDLFLTLTGFTAVSAAVPGTAVVVTTYTATVVIDNTGTIHTQNISIAGGAAQTFTTLLSELNTDLGGFATAALSGGNIRITSATTGLLSSVDITAGTLFSAPLNGFVALVTPVDGNAGDPGTFVTGETVTASGFSAKVLKWKSSDQTLLVKNISGNPTGGTIVTGGTSGATGLISTISSGSVGGVSVYTGGFNLRETPHGITRSTKVGSRVMVEVMVASKNLSVTRADFATPPTFTLTGGAWSAATTYDVSAGGVVTFTIVSSEPVRLPPGTNYAFAITGIGAKVGVLSSSSSDMLTHTFSYPVVTGDIGGTAFTITTGNLALNSGTVYEVASSGSFYPVTAPVAVGGALADKNGVTIQA